MKFNSLMRGGETLPIFNLIMMKRIITCFLLVLVTGALYGQNEKARLFYYKLVYVPDSTSQDLKKEDLMVLWSKSGESLFQSYYSYQWDSVKKEVPNMVKANPNYNPADILAVTSQFPKPKMKYIISKGLVSKNLSYYEEVDRVAYKFSEPLKKLDWKISKETKTVLGYQCQKATVNYGGRSYVAWFSPAIPISDGPYIFNGLPGLILEIYDLKKQYHFSLAGISEREINFQTILPENASKVTKAQLFKASQDYRANIINRLSQNGVTIVDPNDAKAIQQRMNSQNNPIELVY